SPERLAIKGLGQFQRFEAASQLRSLIENWHVSDFHIAQARNVVDAGHAEHLSPSGDNLPLVAQHIYERHPTVFAQILETLKRRVPGVSNVEATETVDGRVVLRFQDGSFQDPFISRFVSDGTIKMFAYLLLLYDPKPLQLLCVEEPENQLYVQLLQELAEEFHSYARRGGQVFVTTHSPDFLDAVPLASIFVVRKRDGFSAVEHPADSETLRALAEAGDPPGALWRQGLLDAGLA
ncbi:AAA family ATPase, partial [Limnoraphis robusta CCNP1324]|uniref:AAA family ATPase n=1 Tax=Limnoraphis robusta TaxID=1118279 RepID=UPI002B20C027